jgi:beta-N-acetylhexosaminidase
MYKMLRVLILAFLLLSTGSSLHTHGSSTNDRIERIIESMSLEERVGQVFMIDFVGAYTSEQDAFVELIRDYKVGSVVLTWPNNNIQNEAENTPLQLAELSNRLQELAYHSSRNEDGEGEGYFLPLFIAMDHEGDGYPRTHFRSGATAIPSAMAIGATWKPEDAQAVGEIIGRELQAVGVNMLLGPVVDVLVQPRPEGAGDMHIRVLGGDPYWVAQMGRAYVRGVHEGSGGSVLTVAKHFPSHVMEPGQTCRVYTNEYHPEWCGFSYGSGSAIWNNSGDCADLRDSYGDTVDTYCY